MEATRWVTAAPFRAHLNHICATTSTPWPVVAMDADLPLGLVRALLDDRPGHRVQRLAPELARQIVAITPERLLELRTTTVSARASRRAARLLLGNGWSAAGLAGRLHLCLSELDAVASGATSEVTAWLELRLAVLLSATMPDAVGRRQPRAA